MLKGRQKPKSRCRGKSAADAFGLSWRETGSKPATLNTVSRSFRFFVTGMVTALSTHSAVSGSYQGQGTKRMAERLEKIARESNPLNNLYMNRERAELFGRQLEQTLALPDSPDKGARVLELASKHATELLLAGSSWEAIEEFTRLDAFVRASDVKFGALTRSSLRHNLAIAYLRLGEQANCLTNHTIDSCLMPIRG